MPSLKITFLVKENGYGDKRIDITVPVGTSDNDKFLTAKSVMKKQHNHTIKNFATWEIIEEKLL